MPVQPAGMVVQVTRRAAERLRAGHLWIYRSDIEAVSGEEDGTALTTVVDSRRIPLGSGLYSTASELAVRMVSPRPGLTRPEYLDGVRERLIAALVLRRAVAPEAFAESVIHQRLPPRLRGGRRAPRHRRGPLRRSRRSATADPGHGADDVREVLRDVLAEEPWASLLVERTDPRIRELEHLPAAPRSRSSWQRDEHASPQTVFHINGLRFHYDAAAGQKTGAFLDQRLNYAAAAARHAHGRALDICTYQGGFALHLAQYASASPAWMPAAPRSKSPTATWRSTPAHLLRRWTGSRPTPSSCCATYDAIAASASTPSSSTRRHSRNPNARRGRDARLQGAEPARAEDALPPAAR